MNGSHSLFSCDSSSPDKTAVDKSCIFPLDHGQHSCFMRSALRPEDHCISVEQHLTPEENLTCDAANSYRRSNPLYENYIALEYANFTCHDFEPQGQFVQQQDADISPLLSVSTQVNVGLASSASYCLYDPGRDLRHENGDVYSALSHLQPTPTNQQPPHSPRVVYQGHDAPLYPPLIQQNIHEFMPSSYPQLSGSPNDNDVREPCIALYSSPYAPTPDPINFGPPVTSPLLVPDSHFQLAFYRAPRPDSTALSCRRLGAQAIEYCGLWIDEEELLKGLKLSGELVIHPCLWEEDRNPCHLWIKGDRSSIHAHIQKWHGVKPGGEKSGVHCRWSVCGKRMLKESIARHVLSVHLGEVWECQGCGKDIARSDAFGQHAVRSSFAACRIAGAVVTHTADARVIDARAALSWGGRVRYAHA